MLPLLMVAITGALLCHGRVVQVLVEAIQRFRGGGPPTPKHPLPADDVAVVRQKRSKAPKSFSRYA